MAVKIIMHYAYHMYFIKLVGRNFSNYHSYARIEKMFFPLKAIKNEKIPTLLHKQDAM